MNPITFNFTGTIQSYTVPVTGTYGITAEGAQGGFGGAGGRSTGGLGASVGGNFALQGGDQLLFVVGQQGSNPGGGGGGGGGGGSFVYVDTDRSGTITQGDQLLLAAGGGGGGGNFRSNPGGSGFSADAAGGSGTGAGGAGGSGIDNNGGGGAGINGGGTNGTGGGSGSGASSITTNGSSPFASGGYGGGGGGGGAGGGGGGGYTGGDGGSLANANLGVGGGGGGRSFNADTSAARTTAGGVQSGNGQADINLIVAASAHPPQAAAPCYVTGTRIRVLRGLTIADMPVEHVRVGDLAITASGKPRPIRWIGSRSYPGLTAPMHDRPVRIQAGALAEGMPARDLLVSPDHCLMVDGLFVAAGHLVNGKTITRGEAVANLTYWHVELDSHDLLMAENTPAESFLAALGVRAGFDGMSEADDADIDPVPYAPRAERHTPEMDALRERLILRAGLSVEPTQFGAVRAWLDVCDGARVAGWAQDDAHPDGPVCLDILVDGAVVALALAQDHRADLAAAGIGDGRHGFDIELDAPLAPGIAHTVEVRRSVDGLRVAAKAVDAVGMWTALLAA